MNYNKYLEQLIAVNKERENEFPKMKVFSCGREKDPYANKFTYEHLDYNFVLVFNKSKKSDVNFRGFVIEVQSKDIKYWDKFSEHEQEIRKEIGDVGLVMNPKTTAKAFWWIRAHLPTANIEDESTWEKGIKWQIDTMLKFLEVFSKYADKSILSKKKIMKH